MLIDKPQFVTARSIALKTQAQSGHYDVSKLQEVFDDLEYFYEEYRAPSETARAS